MPKKSHPTRGEWIEMYSLTTLLFLLLSLTPHGVSGLKFLLLAIRSFEVMSHPTRGEWIEMAQGG